MKDLSRIKQDEKGYYIEYAKSGKSKGQVVKHYGEFRICKVCHEKHFAKYLLIKQGYGKFCSTSCVGKNRTKEKSGSWKGGRTKNLSAGYIGISMPNHPFADCKDYVFEHRLVMERYLGRYLKPEERVHHKGIKYPIGSIENKQDNRIKNLMLFKNRGEHLKFHWIRGDIRKIKNG